MSWVERAREATAEHVDFPSLRRSQTLPVTAFARRQQSAAPAPSEYKSTARGEAAAAKLRARLRRAGLYTPGRTSSRADGQKLELWEQRHGRR